MHRPMKFCNQCGQNVSFKVPEGDTRERHICEHCGTIHYQNPHIVTGCLPVYENSVLLCRRAIEPRRGYWTLPAGFMENGETTEQGALRECWEEAHANIAIEGLYTVYNLPYMNQVYLFYRGQLTDTKFKPGSESLEAALFCEENIPWDTLAFPVMRKTLQYFFSDNLHGNYPFRTEDIIRPIAF